ncbi:MAG: hypothetical protein KA715_03150 [Xanthomonadaceae bacterium]|nr:hypothetical protein [Xanthomonadaceae bacterium]
MKKIIFGILAMSTVSAFAEPKYHHCVIERTYINRPCFHNNGKHGRDVLATVTLYGYKIKAEYNPLRVLLEKSAVAPESEASSFDFETPAIAAIEHARDIATSKCSSILEKL